MQWSHDVMTAVIPFLSSVLPFVTLGTLAVSIVALVNSRSAATSSGISALRGEMRKLESFLLSPETRAARRRVVESPPIIRAAGGDYSPLAGNTSYLGLPGIGTAINNGGARDADELADAYSLICMSMSHAASLAPSRKRGRIAKFWRRNSIALYGHLDEMLSSTDEVRWELNKIPLLWPLDRNKLDSNKSTLLSDSNLKRNIDYLNSRRNQGIAPEIQIPHYPLSSES